MRYRNFIKFSQDSDDFQNEVTQFVKGRREYRKGLLFFPPHSINSGQDGEDFVKNLITVVVEQYAFRVPRILNKNKLYRNARRPKKSSTF